MTSTQERDSLKDKITEMNTVIEQMEEHVKPVLLKKIKVLEGELVSRF